MRLPGGRSTEFYLAQIDAEHAGKTMVISLWDPGDTGQLAANLQILEPTTSSYQATAFNFSAERNSYNASSCNSRSGMNVTSVTTNTGGSSLFNGCWLTIEIPLPINYSAPHPSSDSVTNEGGWWKIPLQHERFGQQLLHGPHDLGGCAARQPRAPRPAIGFPTPR